MKNCYQTPTQNVLEHGLSVRDYLFDLIAYLRGETYTKTWRLPDWIDIYKEQLLANLLDEYTLCMYTTFHDCGKPYCLEIDENGKRHFKNHAKVSGDIFSNIDMDDGLVRNLIVHDMDIHTIKADQLDEFCKMPEAISLLLTGLSEVHSNAQLFGGIESVSFKQKWNQIDRRGRAICKRLF